jgi:hypothetical protein
MSEFNYRERAYNNDEFMLDVVIARHFYERDGFVFSALLKTKIYQDIAGEELKKAITELHKIRKVFASYVVFGGAVNITSEKICKNESFVVSLIYSVDRLNAIQNDWKVIYSNAKSYILTFIYGNKKEEHELSILNFSIVEDILNYIVKIKQEFKDLISPYDEEEDNE